MLVVPLALFKGIRISKGPSNAHLSSSIRLPVVGSRAAAEAAGTKLSMLRDATRHPVTIPKDVFLKQQPLAYPSPSQSTR